MSTKHDQHNINQRAQKCSLYSAFLVCRVVGSYDALVISVRPQPPFASKFLVVVMPSKKQSQKDDKSLAVLCPPFLLFWRV